MRKPIITEEGKTHYFNRGSSKKNNKQAKSDRPFIGWDGEGYTLHRTENPCDCLNVMSESHPAYQGGCPHHYCLFGSSVGTEVRGESLSTGECLRLLLRTAHDHPNAIHVGFAFEYDVNMILRDLSVKHMEKLHAENSVMWKGFRIEHIPKKWFEVSGTVDGVRTTCRVQDVFTFFASSFVAALRNWGTGTDMELQQIEEGKKGRSSFSLSDIDDFIRPYWQKELVLLVQLCNTLRERLTTAGLDTGNWYGPGCVATAVYKKYGIDKCMNQELPDDIIEAGAYAYAGGRFELFRAGLYTGPVYSADINSAYPYILSTLPDLQTGTWEWTTDPELFVRVPTRLGLYRIDFQYEDMGPAYPYPVFRRHKDGRVEYPKRTGGWYHAPEARILFDEYIKDPDRFRYFDMHGAWLYHDDGTYPFSFIPEMYAQRSVWKAEGNPAQLALKLCLNSLYGKLAQRIGGDDGPPRWHQLEWAGAITSGCRALVWEAASFAAREDGLISIDTDGVYSTVPFHDDALRNGKGTKLGQWEMEEYEGILALQSGIYWLKKGGEWQKPKSRGIPRASLSLDSALYALNNQTPLQATHTTFVGYGLSLQRNPKLRGWRTWETHPRSFDFGGNGKRFHKDVPLCEACYDKLPWSSALHICVQRVDMPTAEQLHDLKTGQLSWKDYYMSEQHLLPWRHTTPEKLEQIRQEERYGKIYE